MLFRNAVPPDELDEEDWDSLRVAVRMAYETEDLAQSLNGGRKSKLGAVASEWSDSIEAAISFMSWIRTLNTIVADASYGVLLQLQRQHVTLGSTVHSAFDYDADGLTKCAAAVSGPTVDCTLAAGQLAIHRDAATGAITDTAIDLVTDVRSLNIYGEPAAYTATYDAGGTNTPLASFTWDDGGSAARDSMGRLKHVSETVLGEVHGLQYDYDERGRLKTAIEDNATTWTYIYDANSNRNSGYDANGVAIPSANIAYDAQDRLTQWGDYHYYYDNAGTLTARHNTSTNETVSYIYDLFGNLLSVTFSTTGETITYKVDAYGRRVERILDRDGNGSQYQPETTKYLYNTASQLVAMVDNTGALSQFVYGTNGHVPDLMVKGGNTYRIITDHLGSPRLVVNIANTGDVLANIHYDPWGDVQSWSSVDDQFPFGFAGGLYDPETRLVRFGVRDYDPMTGRWTSKDPILFDGGQEDLYVYVGDDPLNATDPIGLWVFVDGFDAAFSLLPTPTGPMVDLGFGTAEDRSTGKVYDLNYIGGGFGSIQAGATSFFGAFKSLAALRDSDWLSIGIGPLAINIALLGWHPVGVTVGAGKGFVPGSLGYNKFITKVTPASPVACPSK